MISKIIAEFILLAIMLVSHDAHQGKFEIITPKGKKAEVTFARTDNSKSIVEGMHDYDVKILFDKPVVIKYRFVDNGLYHVFKNGDTTKEPYRLDILEFLIELNVSELTGKTQILKTYTGNDRVVVTPGENTVSMSLKRNMSKIIIDKKLIRQR